MMGLFRGDVSSQHIDRDIIRQMAMPLSMMNRQVLSCAYDTILRIETCQCGVFCRYADSCFSWAAAFCLSVRKGRENAEDRERE